MSLDSYSFIAFLFTVILINRLLPERAVVLRRFILLGASLSFYAFFGIRSLVSVLLFALITWTSGLFAKWRPAVPLAVFLLLLLWLSQKGSGLYLLGISFYALQAIGYLLDLSRQSYPAARNPFSLLLFLSFFPLSIQGPICRYPQFREQLAARTPKRAILDCDGLLRILWGFFKKLVIADRIALLTDTLFASPDTARGAYVALALFSYTIQLYADFTGGIDIALGTAYCLGFTLPENFHKPFSARSLADYWQRWHITLGSWFRDYVFYPLSLCPLWERLSPKSILCLSTLLTWCLTGLWHGLSLRFLFWGLANGVLLLIGQLFRRKKSSSHVPALLQMAGVFALTSLLRVFDCYPSAALAFRQLASLLEPAAWRVALTSLFSGSTPSPLASTLFSLPDFLLLLACLPVSFLLSRLQTGRPAPLNQQANVSDRNPDALSCQWRTSLVASLLFLFIVLFGIYGKGYDATSFIYGSFT